jgi:hypothetical protein
VPTAPTVIVAPPPAIAPAPTPPTTIGPYSCDYSDDSCRFIFDGKCDAGTPFCPDTNSDCFDCDPCQTFRLEGCAACTAAGCVWCASDALCLSTSVDAVVPSGVLSCTTSDFVKTCTNENTDDDRFGDPLRESQSWVFEQINLKAAWDLGYSTLYKDNAANAAAIVVCCP